MNKYLRSLPIRQKIIAISMITSISVVILASIVLVFSQYSINQSNQIKASAAIAKITSVNIQAALIFNDKVTGSEILLSLAEIPKIISVEITKPDGKDFVHYYSSRESHQPLLSKIDINEHKQVFSSSEKTGDDSYIIYKDYISFFQPIYIDHKLIGYIDIHTDISQLKGALVKFLLITFFVLIIASFLGYLLIRWMQQYITNPINSLAATIQAVSNDQNYTYRAIKYSNDELGVLTDGFNHMLELIFKRNKQLAQSLTDLEKANKEVKKASLAKSNFLASMSHEIRTPMNGVLGMANLVLQTPLGEKQRRYIEVIQHSGKTLLTIINDILDFSKIEANKITIEQDVFCPTDLIRELENLFSERIRNAQIKLVISIDKEFPKAVRGDANRLNQILYNLLGNAIKFSRQGNIHIYCKNKMTSDKQILLYFEVKDDGMGISIEKQKHLFKPFYQAHNELGNMESGTGLGLAIAQKLCAAMQGEIGVISKPGSGSTFWFTVLLNKASENELNQKNTQNIDSEVSSIKFSAHILLAEDNIVNQDVAIGSLEYFGCKVTVVDNGQKALDRVFKEHFDLLFMDYSMPVMDGISASKRIREQEKIQHKSPIPIIALTAHALTGVKQQCLDAGINDYISKPFSLSDLLLALKTWLPEEQQHQSTQLQTDSNEIAGQQTVALQSLVDSATIAQLRELQQKDSPSILNKMIHHYLLESPKLLQELEQGLKAKNSQLIMIRAHSLKSTNFAMGVIPLAIRFKEIEKRARENHIENISLNEIKQLLPLVFAELEQLQEVEV